MADEAANAETEVEVTAETPSEPVAETPAEGTSTEETPSVETAPEGETPEGEGEEDAPTVPEAYDITLAEEVKLAGGQAITFDAEDPMLKEFQDMARDMGMDQGQFSKFLTLGANFLKTNLDAQTTVTEQQVQAEIAKLGKTPEAATARVEKLSSALAKAGGEQAAFALMNDIRSAEAFEAVEKLVERMNGSGGKRTPALNGTIKERPPIHERLFGSTSQ